MTTRQTLLSGLVAAAALAAVAAPHAAAAPKCRGVSAAAVHTAESAGERVPLVGGTVADLLHGPVEDAACQLP